MTLDRALSRAGIASRTVARGIIASGRIQVEGRRLTDPDAWVEPARQRITLDGKPLSRPRPLYLALHKPTGVITSHGDPDGRKTIYDLVGPQPSWYFPIGRLDQDTSGLLLLTNDSVFAERIANPVSKVTKTYRVCVEPPPTESQIERLRQGLDIGRGEHTAPARVRPERAATAASLWLELEIKEGKNRQIRRMMEALGLKVVALERIRIGKLALGNLVPGAVRPFKPETVL
ncbi:MAG TPA: pseudouridine synthase [Terriglobales bacterium]|nr:pseudouridine synthase [Terriglobales bacterium]